MATTREQRAVRREALIRAAIDVMADQGLAESRLADVASRAGISPGHVLYYFESKADLFLHALRTVEEDLRADVLSKTKEMASAAERWEYLLERAAPSGRGDLAMSLWLEAWELAPRDEHVAGQVQQLEDQWQQLLMDILRHGQQTGELGDVDLASFVPRFSALMDGLTIQVVVGSPHISRDHMIKICREFSQAELSWKPPRGRSRSSPARAARGTRSPSPGE